MNDNTFDEAFVLIENSKIVLKTVFKECAYLYKNQNKNQ